LNPTVEGVGVTLVIGAYTVIGVWLLYHFLFDPATYSDFNAHKVLSMESDLSKSTLGVLLLIISFAVGLVVEDFSDTVFRHDPMRIEELLGQQKVFVDERVLRANILFPGLFDTNKYRRPKKVGVPGRSGLTLDLARSSSFTEILPEPVLGSWQEDFDAVLLDEARFVAMVQGVEKDPSTLPPAVAGKYAAQLKERGPDEQDGGLLKPLKRLFSRKRGSLELDVIPASRLMLFNVAQQLYYQAKNTVYMHTPYNRELEQFHTRIDFARSTLFVSYWLLVLVAISGLAAVSIHYNRAARLWLRSRRLGGDRGAQLREAFVARRLCARLMVARVALAVLILVALTAMCRSVFIHEVEQYHMRTFGYYGTMRSDFGMEVLKAVP
jgi:hypothetical protein